MNKKTKNTLIDISAFAISFILQGILSNFVNLENIFIDITSFLIIFIIIYVVMSSIFKETAYTK